MNRPPIFTIAGRAVTGIDAQLHFQRWALAVEQERNAALIAEVGPDRRALDAARVFQCGAFDHEPACEQLLRQAGIRVH